MRTMRWWRVMAEAGVETTTLPNNIATATPNTLVNLTNFIVSPLRLISRRKIARCISTF